MDRHLLLLLLLMVSFPLRCESWGWFSSSNSKEPSFTDNKETFRGSVAEFSMEGLNNSKGMELLENARKQMVSSNSCWQHAYHHLFAGCSEILAVNEKKSRLAWHLSDCFQRDWQEPFPPL
ncbi:hypothetical protein L6164_037694 [Bauhinia variegata]|uniref:Uncharacterized protein n=1 Tax=Bauhinia variegata TaxID=167791 RepID=A0ACB9KL52_BAUVA|nr:hypothetical protein L6164_037694 [Bauhinia variegata]